VLYLPSGATAIIRGEGRIAVTEAPTTERRDWAYIPAASTPVELRGAGRSSRQVHNFGTPQALDAARLIVCEVITPAENWSSYPPHKHDENHPGHESRLEEIYYFESAPSKAGRRPDAADGAFGMFSTYSSPAGEIEINAMVGTGDIALVPYGYHGPAVAAPGYDLYYLNVMAGPDPERAWLISDDPAHAWVRDTWEGQEFDSRLPYTNIEEGQS
jgi:5-deoxy-glucuronate isomerase